ncbi:PadR family transcriptional regulator [Ruania zhangjianzhongii]|uniref:PadR family transcriptional regulator n=1 Tax=Ruania zhangjianzhongii TaxID=2603206 RepID=UPI0011CA4465|nr:PadR family transcriptional regulator [Ruania zhangjianzhongii]
MILARIILGFLSIGPMTGYDLKRHFDSSAAYFWSADKAQIYRTLASLVDDGLAETEVVPGDGAPDRILHRITPAGQSALDAWLASPLDRQPERDPFLARMFFAGDDAERVRRLVTARRTAVDSFVQELEQVRADAPPLDRGENPAAWLRIQTLEHGIAAGRHELAWLDSLLEEPL